MWREARDLLDRRIAIAEFLDDRGVRERAAVCPRPVLQSRPSPPTRGEPMFCRNRESAAKSACPNDRARRYRADAITEEDVVPPQRTIPFLREKLGEGRVCHGGSIRGSHHFSVLTE